MILRKSVPVKSVFCFGREKRMYFGYLPNTNRFPGALFECYHFNIQGRGLTGEALYLCEL